jgi:hypothetical protein
VFAPENCFGRGDWVSKCVRRLSKMCETTGGRGLRARFVASGVLWYGNGVLFSCSCLGWVVWLCAGARLYRFLIAIAGVQERNVVPMYPSAGCSKILSQMSGVQRY